MKQITLFLLLCILLAGSSVSAQQTVTLKGKTLGRNSSKIFILPATTSSNILDKPAIKIFNNEFQYELHVKDKEAYKLIFEDEFNAGAWNQIIIFPDTSVISLTLHDMNHFDENVIAGGKLNTDYVEFNRLLDNRYKDARKLISFKRAQAISADTYFSEQWKETLRAKQKSKNSDQTVIIFQKQDMLEKTGEDLTPTGNLIRSSSDSLKRDINKLRYAEFSKHITLNNYYLMLKDVADAKNDRYLLMLLNDAYKEYALNFPAHPYTASLGDALAGIIKIFPGNQYIDFKLPDLNGNEVLISNNVKGKVALIDLWGSWCSSCIAKARAVVPIYNKYKKKGFVVIGVAREYKNAQALHYTLKREKFSWLHLIELNDKHGVWNKYSISNGAGLQVLVDTTGKILAVDPTAQELEEILKTVLEV